MDVVTFSAVVFVLLALQRLCIAYSYSRSWARSIPALWYSTRWIREPR